MNPDRTDGASVEQLYRELAGGDSPADGGATGSSDASRELVESVVRELFPGESFEFDEEHVKNALDELLVVLVALGDGETHGKGLMEDLSECFDARLSPGTVYPRLHALDDAGVLAVHELVRTKEYRIADEGTAREEIESAMRQHLALGFVLYAALEEL